MTTDNARASDTIKAHMDKLRAAASRGPVTTREIFAMTDPIMDELSRILAATSAPADVEGLVGGETRTLAVDAVWKPCVHGGGWWIAKNADGGDVLLSSDTPQSATALTAQQAEIERLRGERDEALASAAAAYEKAAQVADSCEKQNSPKISDYHKGLSSGGQAIAAGIRALATEAESTALAVIVDAETRDCAAICNVNDQVSGWVSRDAILARLDQHKDVE